MTETTHLYRGAPSVRGWSKYQATVEGWTLCGIKRKKAGSGRTSGEQCTEDASLVNCPYCRQLMRPTRAEIARAKVKKAAPEELRQAVEHAARWLTEHGHVGRDLPEDVTGLTFRLLTYVPPEEVDWGCGFWMYCLETGELYHVSGTWIWRSPRRFHGAELGGLTVEEVSLVPVGACRFADRSKWKVW
jgi:hypothetical protein